MLSGSENRGQRGGVMVVRVERRQAGEEVCTTRDLAFASSRLESCARGNKRRRGQRNDGKLQHCGLDL